jgi:hypothetical protein
MEQNEDPKSAEVAAVDSTTSTALATGLSLEDFKSFYYLINAKPDRETKFYSESKIVSVDDLIELDNLIQEKLNLGNVVTTMVTAVVTLDNNRSMDFGSWDQFKAEQWHTSAVTKAVTVVWDFSIKLNNYHFPQRHTVKLRIGSRLKPRDVLELVMNHEEDSQLHEAFAHTICSIDFINTVISSEIFLIVENWHKALPNNFYTAKWQKVLKNNSKKVEQFIVFLVLVAGSTFLFWLSKFFLNLCWTETVDAVLLSRIYGGILGTFLILFLFYEGGKLWANRTERYIDRIKPLTLFKFTRGDTNANLDNKKKNNEILKSIGVKMLATILFNLFAFASEGIFNILTALLLK